MYSQCRLNVCIIIVTLTCSQIILAEIWWVTTVDIMQTWPILKKKLPALSDTKTRLVHQLTFVLSSCFNIIYTKPWNGIYLSKVKWLSILIFLNWAWSFTLCPSKFLPGELSCSISTSSMKVLCFLQNVGDIWLCQVTFAVSLEEVCELCEKQWKENLWHMVSFVLLCSQLCYVPLDGGW